MGMKSHPSDVKAYATMLPEAWVVVDTKSILFKGFVKEKFVFSHHHSLTERGKYVSGHVTSPHDNDYYNR